MFRILVLPRVSKNYVLMNQSVLTRFQSSTISTVQQILDYDISDALVNRTELTPDRKKKKSPATQRKMLENKFKELFNFSEVEAVKIVEINRSSWKIPLLKINTNIECLHGKNVKAQSILDNLWILGVPTSKFLYQLRNVFWSFLLGYLEEKIQLIEKLQPRDINDFLPLIRVSVPILSRTQSLVLEEMNLIPERHRIYYLSKRLEVEPALVSKYFAINMFMFEIAFDMLEKNLNIMLENGTQGSSVLNNLSIFKSSPGSIKTSQEHYHKDTKRLKPLLFNCHEDLFGKTSTPGKERSTSENNTVVEYISHRLGYGVETTRSMLNEKLARIRIEKVRFQFELHLEKIFKHFLSLR